MNMVQKAGIYIGKNFDIHELWSFRDNLVSIHGLTQFLQTANEEDCANFFYKDISTFFPAMLTVLDKLFFIFTYNYLNLNEN